MENLGSKTVDGQEYTLVGFTIDSDYACGIFTSCSKVSYIAQAGISLATALDGCFIGCAWLRHYIGACLVGTTAALALMTRSLRSGGGLLPAWRGLLIFSLLCIIS